MAVGGYTSPAITSPTGYSANLSGVMPLGTRGGPTSLSTTQGANFTQSQGTQQSQSNTYIPDYSQTPILNEIAQYSRSMAPQVYQWGMDQYNKNQGNIDAMMRNALSYASPQRIASEMGRAEAGVQQGAEAGRQNAIRDLQSYGIDPSSGRYAALDKANQVMAGAAAAGAGNQQREATTAAGTQMQQAAQGLSETNYQTGYGTSNAMNQLLGTGMSLKYSPLGTTSSSSSQNTSSGGGYNEGFNLGGIGQGTGGSGGGDLRWVNPGNSELGSVGASGSWVRYAEGGGVDQPTGYAQDDATTGGFVSNELSPSNGGQTDDVKAQLNAGEFVIPKDVAQWKGQEFFYKLMAQARTMRATAGQQSGNETGPGYAGGGDVGGYQGGPSYNSGAGQARVDADPYDRTYRQLTPPRMGWWGKEPGNMHEQTPDIRQYPELYGGTRGGWQPWVNPGDIGYAFGKYTQPIDPYDGQPQLISPGEGAPAGVSGGRVGMDLARQTERMERSI